MGKLVQKSGMKLVYGKVNIGQIVQKSGVKWDIHWDNYQLFLSENGYKQT